MRSCMILGLMAAVVAILVVVGRTTAQAPSAPRVARMADGKPNLNGIWEANNTANWDIQSHQARQGVVVGLGAAFSIPGGLGVVVGNEIPYKPEALAKKQENAAHWMTADPEIKCYLPGVPRANYMPYPFQIVQSTGGAALLITYEFASAARIVRMNSKEESPTDTWMGWSRGRWEGETLVIDVTSFTDQTWFDRAGNYHSDALHVVERYTPMTLHALRYDVTIEDPKVFTRPWTMRMPIHRQKDVGILEYECHALLEESGVPLTWPRIP